MHLARRTLLAAGLTALVGGAAAATPFPDKVGQRRLLLIFAGSANSDRFNHQMALVASPMLRQRDFDLIEVVGNDPIKIDGVPQDAPTAQQLRDLYRIVGDFGVRVVGKDGEVKLATSRYVTMQQLVELVDAMPMRQQEMRERGES